LWIRKKIKSLTQEQQKLLLAVREEWLRVGLAVNTDWAATNRILPTIYFALGLEPPKSVITVGSPRAGLLAAAKVGESLLCEPYDTRDDLRRQVRHRVGRAVRNQVWTYFQQEVEGPIRHQLRDLIRAQLQAERPNLFYRLGDVEFGLHEAPWLASCDFFSRVGVEALPPIGPWMDLARAGAGWWWPFRAVAVVSSAPLLINRDAEGRLHCECGPALVYPDGWAIWAIHGVTVSRKVVTDPLSLSVAEIVQEPDLAVRRVMLERFGYERFVREAGLRPIQADRFGRLYRLDPGWNEAIALVEVLNGTPEPDGSRHRYYLCVPPTLRTAHAAVAWTFGLRPREYQPWVES
jgi:uncharacterized protein DUF6745